MNPLIIICTPYNSLSDLEWRELNELGEVEVTTLVDVAREWGYDSVVFRDLDRAPHPFRLAVERLMRGDFPVSCPVPVRHYLDRHAF